MGPCAGTHLTYTEDPDLYFLSVEAPDPRNNFTRMGSKKICLEPGQSSSNTDPITELAGQGFQEQY